MPSTDTMTLSPRRRSYCSASDTILMILRRRCNCLENDKNVQQSMKIIASLCDGEGTSPEKRRLVIAVTTIATTTLLLLLPVTQSFATKMSLHNNSQGKRRQHDKISDPQQQFAFVESSIAKVLALDDGTTAVSTTRQQQQQQQRLSVHETSLFLLLDNTACTDTTRNCSAEESRSQTD